MVESFALSDPGLVRSKNEDRYLINPESHLYQIADGMGGHTAGEEAARLTVATVDDFVSLLELSREITWPFGYDISSPFEYNVLRTGLLLANLRVFQTANEMQHYAGMGSTAVVVWIRGKRAFFSHVGDSRIYLCRNNELIRLTQDHSLVQEQINSGLISAEEARTHALRHVVTRAIGMQDGLQVDVDEEQLQHGDEVMLCCDGLSDEITDEQILEIMVQSDTAEASCQGLLEAAKQAGGRDNITCVVLRYFEE